jgi:hypothetical protein
VKNKLTNKGNLRLLQVFACLGPLCDCGSCAGSALVLCGDDEKTGFALSRRCADESGALDKYKAIAEEVKDFVAGDSIKIPLPPWKAGSIKEWSLDIPILLRALGVMVNIQSRAFGADSIEVYVPENITTTNPPQRKAVSLGR